MSNLMKSIIGTALALTALTANAQSGISIKNEAFIERVEVKPDGKKVTKVEPAVKVLPGDEVIFVITYRNGGDKPATDVVVTNPIPKNMTYRTASGDNNEVTEVSVDGGKKYDQLEKLSVDKDLKVRSTAKVVRKAVPSDVTHVRWRIAGALAPKSEGKVRLRAVLN